MIRQTDFIKTIIIILLFYLISINLKIYATSQEDLGKMALGCIVLISRYTGSAAEDFVAAIRESKRAVIIGETTGGWTGNGLFSILPGYGKLRVSVNIGAFVSGEIWQSKGIEPDIEVSRTIGDIFSGHDPVLAKGLKVLKELMNKEKIK
jgi:C-terminal processing protease CtpA/Prc